MTFEVSITKRGELGTFWSKVVPTREDAERVAAKNQRLIDHNKWEHTITIKEVPMKSTAPNTNDEIEVVDEKHERWGRSVSVAMEVEMSRRDIHLRKNPDDATMKPVECGKTGVASITEAWGYYGPGGEGHKEVCTDCIAARAAKRGAKK